MNVYRNGPETDRLIHRAFSASDAEAFLNLNSDQQVMKYTCEPLLQSLAEARRCILDYPDFDEIGFGRWACVLKSNQTVIGFCGLKYLPDLQTVDVGYRFLPEYWGQGLATEACIASLNFGLMTIKLPEIIGLVLPDNTASIRVLQKAGMGLEGEFQYDGVKALKYVIGPQTCTR